MKTRGIWWTIVLTSVCWTGLLALSGHAQENLVANGEFTENADGWMPIDVHPEAGWQNTPGWNGNPGWFWLDNSAEIEPGVNQLITGLQPGETYMVSGYYKSVEVWSGWPAGLLFQVLMDSYVFFRGGSEEVTDWTPFSFYYHAFDDADVLLRFRRQFANDSDYGIDNIRMIHVPTDTIWVDAANVGDPQAHGSEDHPFWRIQDAIDAASIVDTVMVRPGSYAEVLDLSGKAIWLRSTDPGDPDVVAATIIDATGLGQVSVVTCVSGEGSDTLISGFTITGGTGTNDGSSTSGGGMYNADSSPMVTNCVFSANSAGTGGGMVNWSGNPTIANCTFTGNTVGGGIYSEFGSLNVVGCVFSDNVGGGLVTAISSATVDGCTFAKNRAVEMGGAIAASAPESPFYVDLTVTNCAFVGNSSADMGGAMFSIGWAFGVFNVTNCMFVGNSAASGGAMYNFQTWPTVTNCTFSGNSATDAGGAIYADGWGYPTVVSNCILWGNNNDQVVGDATVTFSDVQGGWPGETNIGVDPLFLRNPDDGGDGWGDDPGTPGTDEGANDDFGDLRLQAGSPCADAGNNMAVPADAPDIDGDGDAAEPMPLDLDLHLRFANDSLAADTGNPSLEIPDRIVDMGAYETSTAGDCDGDGYVNLPDHAVFCLCLTGPGGEATPSCRMVDLDDDDDVDAADYCVFQRLFTGAAP